MPNHVKRIIARYIMNQYNLNPVINIRDNISCRGRYIPEQDKVILNGTLEVYDFVKTTIHEAKHVMDAMKYGRFNFEKKYNQAGTVAANCGNDPYVDNKWEIRAEKFAEREMKTKWKDLKNGISKEDKE